MQGSPTGGRDFRPFSFCFILSWGMQLCCLIARYSRYLCECNACGWVLQRRSAEPQANHELQALSVPKACCTLQTPDVHSMAAGGYSRSESVQRSRRNVDETCSRRSLSKTTAASIGIRVSSHDRAGGRHVLGYALCKRATAPTKRERGWLSSQ